MFLPKKEIPHDDFTCIEQINNDLLQHPQVKDYLNALKKGKSEEKDMLLMFDENTEKLAKKIGLEIIFPPAKMRTFLDNKVNTNRIAEKVGVPYVPCVLSIVSDYAHLNKVSKVLGTDLGIQTPLAILDTLLFL